MGYTHTHTHTPPCITCLPYRLQLLGGLDHTNTHTHSTMHNLSPLQAAAPWRPGSHTYTHTPPCIACLPYRLQLLGGLDPTCSRSWPGMGSFCVPSHSWAHALPAVGHEGGSPGACNSQLPPSWYTSCQLLSAHNTWWCLQTFQNTFWWHPGK